MSVPEFEKIAFEGPKSGPDRGYTVRASYLKQPNNGDAMIEIFKDGQPLRRFLFPAYKIWNIAAHFGDIVDGEIEGNASGYEMAAWTGFPNASTASCAINAAYGRFPRCRNRRRILLPSRQRCDQRSYGMFGFLSGVRNYSAVTPISYPPVLPEDVSPEVWDACKEWGDDGHSHSWLTVQELSNFDYNQVMEDRRVTINGNGGCTCEPGKGEKMTYRQFLGQFFFDELQRVKDAGAERVVFWFDN